MEFQSGQIQKIEEGFMFFQHVEVGIAGDMSIFSER
jgi:hypothetical protein